MSYSWWSLESWERGLGPPSHKVSEYKAGIYGSAAQRRTLSKWSASGMDIAARVTMSICVVFQTQIIAGDSTLHLFIA